MIEFIDNVKASVICCQYNPFSNQKVRKNRMNLSFPLNMAIFVSILPSAYSDAIRHWIPIESATRFRGIPPWVLFVGKDFLFSPKLQ